MTIVFLQGDSVWNVLNVRSLFPEFLPSVSIREFTLEKGLMSAVNAGNILPVTPPSVTISEFTLEKSLMSAVNVGNLTPLLHLTTITTFTME